MSARQNQRTSPVQFDSEETVPRWVKALSDDETTAQARAGEARKARQDLDQALARRRELDAEIPRLEAVWREKDAVAKSVSAQAGDTRKILELVAPGALNGRTQPAYAPAAAPAGPPAQAAAAEER